MEILRRCGLWIEHLGREDEDDYDDLLLVFKYG